VAGTTLEPEKHRLIWAKQQGEAPHQQPNGEVMVTRTREVLQYIESCDPKVTQAGIEVKTRQKWRAAEAVDAAEARLRHRALVGAVASGRAGLGCSTTPHYEEG